MFPLLHENHSYFMYAWINISISKCPRLMGLTGFQFACSPWCDAAAETPTDLLDQCVWKLERNQRVSYLSICKLNLQRNFFNDVTTVQNKMWNVKRCSSISFRLSYFPSSACFLIRWELFYSSFTFLFLLFDTAGATVCCRFAFPSAQMLYLFRFQSFNVLLFIHGKPGCCSEFRWDNPENLSVNHHHRHLFAQILVLLWVQSKNTLKRSAPMMGKHLREVSPNQISAHQRWQVEQTVITSYDKHECRGTECGRFSQ